MRSFNYSNDELLNQEFLGRGWSFPIEMENGQPKMVALEQDVQQAIRIILGTQPGERVMRPEFGTPLRELVFEPINVTTCEIVRSRVERSLQRWEPRIDVLLVSVTAGGRGTDYRQTRTGLLNIEIRYRIRTTNTEDNLVYPFYLTESQRT
jgi:phage baseplate assembly protein W